MESVKKRIFNYLTQYQKSEMCHHVSKFVKKHFEKSADEMLDLIIEEEIYYLDVDSSRHPWIAEFVDDEAFHKDLMLYIKENQRKYKFKDSQKEYIEKQKAYAKEQRKKIKLKIMDKEPPTKAQLSYYKALSKKYNVDTSLINIEIASKLDLVNILDFLLSEQHLMNKEIINAKLKEIIENKEIKD